jgi:hypothetical protein
MVGVVHAAATFAMVGNGSTSSRMKIVCYTIKTYATKRNLGKW